MAKPASNCLFLFLLSLLILCSSGTLVGFFYDARKPNSISSSAADETISFLKLNKIHPSQIRVFVQDFRVLEDSFLETNVTVDLYLDDKHSAISSLKAHLLSTHPHVKIKSIIVGSSRTDLPGKIELQLLLSTLKSVRSMLKTFRLEREVKVSVKFSVSFLGNLKRENKKHERDLNRILNFIKKIGSFVIVEDNIEGELNNGDKFVESVIKRANLAISALPCSNIPIVLNIKNSALSPQELAELSGKLSRVLENTNHIEGKKIVQLFVEANLIKDFEKKEQIFHSSHRELQKNLNFETTEYDTNYPPTNTLPTTPINNPSPTIVTVTPNPIYNTPVSVPSTAVPVPVTNPVTTPSTVPTPVTNPVTTYPAPAGGVPVTPPVTGNAPVGAGQSWCVAKSGASQAALQAALDYACGIGGADCSVIQQGGSCYNPNSLQGHASYAFNSYYQKNPVQTSCDFGGSATVTNTNPSTGSCIFPSSASSANSSPTPMPTTTSPTPIPLTPAPPIPTLPPPITPMPPTPMLPTPMPQTPPASGETIPGYGAPPSVLNSSNPASGTTIYGDGPPSVNNTSSVSPSICLYPLFGRIILVTIMIAGKFVLDM